VSSSQRASRPLFIRGTPRTGSMRLASTLSTNGGSLRDEEVKAARTVKRSAVQRDWVFCPLEVP
jgi:hypothetical protein